jgi:mannose-6-phosphate isomerase
MRPRPVEPTRVYRFYRGGELIGRLRGTPELDDVFPEDWLASVTPASSPGRDEPLAGLSRLTGGGLLRDAVAADPEAWLGAAHIARFGHSTGLLVKLLDAAVRLPVHAHPDRAFARQHFGSPFGKTEAWVVLATRSDESEVWLGLREPVEAAVYRGWIERQDTERLLGTLHRVTVRAGDTLFVPAGVPHAIGAGVLIAEVQEPSDFSIICEWSGFPIAAEDSHLGVGWDVALGALELESFEPTRGLPAEASDFFWVDDVAEPAGRFGVLLVVAGDGTIDGAPARAGDAFALAATCEPFAIAGDLRVLRFLAPIPEAPRATLR